MKHETLLPCTTPCADCTPPCADRQHCLAAKCNTHRDPYFYTSYQNITKREKNVTSLTTCLDMLHVLQSLRVLISEQKTAEQDLFEVRA